MRGERESSDQPFLTIKTSSHPSSLTNPLCLFTVREFDDAATRRWFGFESVDEYYAAASSGHHIHTVDTPLLCVQALDDPICPAEAIPYHAFSENQHLILLTTPTGECWQC